MTQSKVALIDSWNDPVSQSYSEDFGEKKEYDILSTKFRFHVECPIYIQRQFSRYSGVHLQWIDKDDDYLELSDEMIEIIESLGDDGDFILSSYKRNLERQKLDFHKVEMILHQANRNKKISYPKMIVLQDFYRGILGTSFISTVHLVCDFRSLETIWNAFLSVGSGEFEAKKVASMMLDEIERIEMAPIILQRMIEKNNWERIGESK